MQQLVPFDHQDFRIIGDSYTAIDAVCQFKYRGYEISASTIGNSRGGCPTKVAVFASNGQLVYEDSTIEQAIRWVNANRV